MRILLDTHIALWALADSSKPDQAVIKVLEASENEIFFSLAPITPSSNFGPAR